MTNQNSGPLTDIDGMVAGDVSDLSKATPIGWPTAQRICDIPEVREALDKFAEDAREENMLAMVSAIIGHASAQGRAAGLEEAADPMPDCPRCDGSGEEEVMDGDGPDAHPIMVNCTHCGGVGSLSAAYKHLLAELATAKSKYLDACGRLYFANLSPASSDAGKDDARDAARYRWLRDMDMFGSPSVELAEAFQKRAGGALDSAIDQIMSSLEVIGKGEKG